MNNTIKLAVASALLAAASSANAGITIPAGDWTLDIGGVVNMYYTSTRHTGDAGVLTAGANNNGASTKSNLTTGLLPNFLTVSGKTRQNLIAYNNRTNFAQSSFIIFFKNIE